MWQRLGEKEIGTLVHRMCAGCWLAFDGDVCEVGTPTSKFEYEEPTAVGVGTAGGCTERLYDDTDHTAQPHTRVHVGM